MKLLKFGAEWCGSCRLQAREFNENPVNVEVQSIDVDDDTEDLSSKYKVLSIPVLALVNDKGELIHKWIGFTKSEVINKYIADETESKI